LQRSLQLFAALNLWLSPFGYSSLQEQTKMMTMQPNNWKWITFFLAVVLAIAIMVWKSQQRIKELDKQLDHSQTSQ
jgi:hypothetical protein